MWREKYSLEGLVRYGKCGGDLFEEEEMAFLAK
jgi:hypothetical protein